MRERLLPLLLLLSCVSPRGAGSSIPAQGTVALPRFLVTARDGTVRFAANPAATLGGLSKGVALEVEPGVDAGLLRFHSLGRLELWGRLSREQLGVVACAPGTIPGTSLYAGRGDILALRSEIEREAVRVSATAHVRELKQEPRTFTEEGTLPLAALCTAATEPLEPGEPMSTVAGLPIAVLDAPSGKARCELPASEYGHVLRQLEERDGHLHVLLGEGPYLEGWIARSSAPDPGGVVGGLLGVGGFGVPQVLRVDRTGKKAPLRKVKAGAELLQNGERVARLNQEGFARVYSEDGEHVWAAVAVDEDGWAEAWLRKDQLGEVVAGSR